MKEVLVTLMELVLYAFVGSILVVLGAFAELTSLGYIATGNYVFGIWLIVMGGIALYAGIIGIGAKKVLPRLRNFS